VETPSRRSRIAQAIASIGRFWRDEWRALTVGGIALLVAATADLGAGVVLS